MYFFIIIIIIILFIDSFIHLFTFIYLIIIKLHEDLFQKTPH
jgi:hypothetical protein